MNKREELEFKNWNEWAEHIAQGCEHMREPPFVSIPSALPKCALTDKVCRYDICPKKKDGG